MALNGGFFNAVQSTDEEGNIVYDRTYYASDFNKYLNRVVSNGVFATPSNNLQVLASSGMEVIIKTGGGRIDGAWLENDSDFTITLDEADVILNRIDRIVMQLNYSDRTFDIVYKVGELASNPVAPSLIRTEQIIEYSLARIYVAKGTTTITQSMITDTRPLEDECGLIATMGEMESNNYFIQMQDYIENYISTKSSEYETWEETMEAAFDSWFESIKEDVRTTTLYREYSSVYASTKEGQQDITIPATINYQNNGLDVLNVFINGMRLLKDVEYTISSDGTSIHLTTPLDVIGTDIEFVNKKSIDGTAAESVVVQVEALEEKVNSLQCYTCTGINDNVLLSDMVKTFLDGTGSFAGVAGTAQLKINVNGTIGISELIDDQIIFDFVSSTSSPRRVIVDFANATIPKINIASYSSSIIVGFNMDSNVIVENANLYMNDADLESTATIYGVHGGIARNCRINLDGKKEVFYGVWGADEVSNSEITINNLAYREIYGVYETKKILYNTIETDAINGAYVSSTSGICIGNIGKSTGSYPIEGNFRLGSNVANYGNIEEE